MTDTIHRGLPGARGVRIVPAITLLALQTGCIGFQSYRFSEPIAPSPEARVSKGTLQLETNDVRLRVKAVNTQMYRDTVVIGYLPAWENVEAPDYPLRVLVEIEPLAKGLTLDPTGFTYLGSDGSETKPRLAEVDGVSYDLAGLGRTGCGAKPSRSDDVRRRKRAGRLALDESTWIRVHFPVSEDPRAQFTLRITGFCKGESPVAVPPIHFKSATSRRFYMATVN